MTEPPLACSLDRSSLEARLASAAEVGAASLTAHDQEAGRHLLRFRPDPGVGAQLEKIITAERECCSFLEITLVDSGSELELAIEAPSGGQETADGLAAAFSGGRSATPGR